MARAFGHPETDAPRPGVEGHFFLSREEGLPQQGFPRAERVSVKIFHHLALPNVFSAEGRGLAR